MEENPLDSRDVMYGVPTLFQEIMQEITREVDACQNAPIIENKPESPEDHPFKVN